MTNPPLIAALGYFESLQPLNETFNLPINLYHGIRASVSGLLVQCGPFAILFRVALGVVFSFKRLTDWTLSHVAKEIHKPLPPRVTNRDSARSVSEVVFVGGIMASLDHSQPCVVPPDSLGVNSEFALGGCASTSARSRVSNTHICTNRGALFTAIAKEYPMRHFSVSVRIPECRELAEPLTSYVLEPVSPFSDSLSRFIHGDFMFGFSADRCSKQRFRMITI